MTKLEKLKAYIPEMDGLKKEIVISLLSDFLFLEKQIEDLKKYPRYTINPNNPLQQKKLPVHDMLKDFQAQKNDIATKILKTIDVDGDDESPLMKALKEFTNE